jgi:hypothetical protein
MATGKTGEKLTQMTREFQLNITETHVPRRLAGIIARAKHVLHYACEIFDKPTP